MICDSCREGRHIDCRHCCCQHGDGTPAMERRGPAQAHGRHNTQTHQDQHEREGETVKPKHVPVSAWVEPDSHLPEGYDPPSASMDPAAEPRPYLPDVRRDLADAVESNVVAVSPAIQRLVKSHIPNLIAMVNAALIDHVPMRRGPQVACAHCWTEGGDREPWPCASWRVVQDALDQPEEGQ